VTSLMGIFQKKKFQNKNINPDTNLLCQVH
jgi:hypothetical protein